MTSDKIKELRHIQQMILAGGDVDEINARVWCVATGKLYVGFNGENHMWNTKAFCRNFPVGEEVSWNKYELIPYLTSLDAIKGLEREGWAYQIFRNSHLNTCRAIKGKGDVYDATSFTEGWETDLWSETLPTEHAARLYAVLETWIYEEEQSNDQR